MSRFYHIKTILAILFEVEMINSFLLKLRAAGWTQEQIAEKTGIPQSAVSKYMRGKTCTVETLVKIAKAFNVSTDTVLGLDEQPEEPEPRQKPTASHKGNCYAE
jgi:transcriptional regulator with XRE-family HTH domain